MNQIRPSLLPVATTPTPEASEAIEQESPVEEGKFDTLLRQRSGETSKSAKPRETTSLKDAHTRAAAGETAPDAETQAEIAGMLVQPQALPLVEPEREIVAPGIGEVTLASTEGAEIAPAVPLPDEIPIPIFESAGDNFMSLPAFPGAPPPVPAATPAREANPDQAGNTPLQPQVANVRGIMPPVQNARSTSAEATAPAAVPFIKPASIEPTAPANIPPKLPPEGARISNPQPIAAAEPIVTDAAAPAVSGRIDAAISSFAPAPVISEPNAVVLPKPIQTMPAPEEAPVAAKNTIVSPPENLSGMTAAKPGGAMSAPTLPRSQRSAPANPAASVPEETKGPATPIEETPRAISAPVAAMGNERERSTRNSAEKPDRSPTAIADFSTNQFPIEGARQPARTDAPASIPPADIAQVVTHTQVATERLRASGQERLEVAVKLESGQELTIQLRIANGQITSTIRTESEPLRLALEQNWSLFSQRGGDREVRISTPVFESPQTSSNMSDPNQQRDGRQRAFNEPAPDFSAFQTARRNVAPNTPRATTLTNASGTGVQLYA